MSQYACPECGDTFWRRFASGTYTSEEYFFAEVLEIQEEDIETDRMDTTPWKDHLGHEATDEIHDALAELDGA